MDRQREDANMLINPVKYFFWRENDNNKRKLWKERGCFYRIWVQKAEQSDFYQLFILNIWFQFDVSMEYLE